MNRYYVSLSLPVLALGVLCHAYGAEENVDEVSVNPNQVVVQVYGIV